MRGNSQGTNYGRETQTFVYADYEGDGFAGGGGPAGAGMGDGYDGDGSGDGLNGLSHENGDGPA